MNNNIAILIVTFNRQEYLKIVLESALSIGSEIKEIFIVNNASTDNTKIYLDSLNNNSVHIIHNEVNTGGAGGFNLGTRMFINSSSCEWLWMMDDDILPTRECILALISSISEVGIYQPIRVDLNGELILQQKLANKKLSRKYFIPVKSEEITPNSKIKISTIPFEGPLVHRSIFSTIGFPDPNYFLFYDDTDFSFRAIKNNIPIYLITNAIMKRLIAIIPNQNNRFRNYFMIRNKLIFEIKNLNIIWIILYLPLNIINLIINTIIRRGKIRLTLIAIYDGIRCYTDRKIDQIKKL